MAQKKTRLTKQQTSKEIKKYHKDFNSFLTNMRLDHLASLKGKEDKDA